MIRSQIYLTTTERKELHILAQNTGRSQSELIRDAIDQFLLQQRHQQQNKLTTMRAAKGLWKNRGDDIDFTQLRQEFDRY